MSNPGQEMTSRRGMNIAFKDLDYSVPHRKEKGTMAFLLKQVTGYLNPGEMTALVRPIYISWHAMVDSRWGLVGQVGKSTLLDVLAGRKTQGKIDGTILFSANKASTTFIRRYTGYVEQFDTLIGNLTVQEMLQYTAELKRPISEPLSRKKEEVRRLVKRLALEKCRDTKIGTALSRGISGGQAKRVNIGLALVTDPKILFLDEPTSGLDSSTSNEVIRVVKLLATDDNVTICATIHSPSMKAFRLFDRVMMLVRGQVSFFGRRVDAVPYFETVGSDTPIEEAENEAEWLIDIVVSADLDGKAPQLAEQFDKSPLKQSVLQMVDHNLNDKTELDEETKAAFAVTKETVAPSWSALRTLIKFRTWSNLRSPEFILGRTGDKIVVMIIVAILFSNIGDNPQRDFIDISALLFVWVIFPAFGATAYIPEIVQERALFYRERNDGLYRVIVYLMSKMIDETVLAFVTSIILGAILWAATGIEGSYIIFAITYFGVLMNGIMCGYLFGAISPNLSIANAALPGYLSTTIFLTGFFIRYENIPSWIRWYSKLSFPFYAWNALMAEEFPDPDNKEDNIYISTGPTEQQTILDYYNITESTGFYLAWVFVFAGVYFILTYLTMSFVKYQRR